MQRRKLLVLAATGVISLGVIAWLIIQRPLMQPPPFSFIPTSDDLIHWQFDLEKEEMLGVPGSCRIYSFPADFNSICLQADAELVAKRELLAKEKERTANLTLQLGSLQGQVEAYAENQKVLVTRNDKLVIDLIECDRKYQNERVKPRWGSPVAWTIAAVASSVLAGVLLKTWTD